MAENTAECLARLAWAYSCKAGTPNDITGLALEIANQWGGNGYGMRDQIVIGLRGLSGDEVYSNGNAAEFAEIGKAEMGTTEIYWWHNGAETSWSPDQPEWWDAQIEQWAA